MHLFSSPSCVTWSPNAAKNPRKSSLLYWHVVNIVALASLGPGGCVYINQLHDIAMNIKGDVYVECLCLRHLGVGPFMTRLRWHFIPHLDVRGCSEQKYQVCTGWFHRAHCSLPLALLSSTPKPEKNYIMCFSLSLRVLSCVQNKGLPRTHLASEPASSLDIWI